MLRFDLCGI